MTATVDSSGRLRIDQPALPLAGLPLPTGTLPDNKATIVPQANGNFALIDQDGTCWGVAAQADTLKPGKNILNNNHHG